MVASGLELILFVSSQFFFFFLLFAFLRVVPDAVSSSEDPLAGDQSATAGVVKVGAALVLQRNLKMAKDTLILNEY